MRSIVFLSLRVFALIALLSGARAAAAQQAPIALPLTTDPSDQAAPAISGDQVVWQDDRHGQWDIYAYDLASGQERRVTADGADQTCPAVSGSRVVWADRRTGRPTVYAADLSAGTEQPVDDTIELLGCPAIDGAEVAWIANTPSRDVYVYHLTRRTLQRLNIPPAAERQDLRIWGDRVVRQDRNAPGPWQLYVHQRSSGLDQRVGPAAANQESSSIWWDRIVSQEERGAGAALMFYDLGRGLEQPVAGEAAQPFHPALFAHQVVWEDRRSGTPDIYLRNLLEPAERPIATGPAEQAAPAIWNDRIVWQERRQGQWDIWFARTTPFRLRPRHPLASGLRRVYHFVNFAWGTHIIGARRVLNFGMDFGFCPLGDALRASRNALLPLQLDQLQGAGVEGIRWWMIPDGRNLTFDADRAPTGRGAGFRDDLWRVLDWLAARRMSVVFTLIDGNNWFKPAGEFQGALFGHTALLTETGKRQAFYELVITPILEDILLWHLVHPQIAESPVAGIDLGNELLYGTDPYRGTGASIEDMQRYVRDAASMVHRYLPGVPVTTAAATARDLADHWTDQALGVPIGQGLDYYDIHHYGSEPLQGPGNLNERYGLDRLPKRIYLGEFPGANGPLGSFERYLMPVGGLRSGRMSGGWLSGAWLWSLNSEDLFTPSDPLAAMRQVREWLDSSAFDAPDVIINAARVSPSRASAGQSVWFPLVIGNRGSRPAAPHHLELWLDGTKLSTVSVPEIAGRSAWAVTLPQPSWIATPGVHAVWAKTDVWLEVPEDDEDNNEWTTSFFVSS